MPTAPTKPKSPTNGWTPARRAKQAAAIRRWRPWQSSTGPRTASGKARAAQNAAKPWTKNSALTILKSALGAQRRYIRAVQIHTALQKNCGQNELMDSMNQTLLEHGRNVTVQLAAALLLCQTEQKCGLGPPTLTLPCPRHYAKNLLFRGF